MNHYKKYMDDQGASPALHKRLLELAQETGTHPSAKRPWATYAAMAACCTLVLGLGVWGLTGDGGGQLASDTLYPGITDSFGPGEVPPPDGYFSIQGLDGAALLLPNVPYINYPQAQLAEDSEASIALPYGSFDRELTGEELAGLFGQQQLPCVDLGWADYTLTGRATYDGAGTLLWLFLFGQHPSGAEFTLSLAPDGLPPSCLVSPGRETSLVNGVEVVGYSHRYDRNVDGVTDDICTSEFMVGEVGVRFESVNSPFAPLSEDGQLLGQAQLFNALLVRWATAADGGLTLSHLRTTNEIPAWREATFSTLAQARQETEFAHYLPQRDVAGYGAFYGKLTYQQGNEHVLWVRWSRGYDDVEIHVSLPQGERVCNTVDAANPASYDTRLYQIPWADSVPEEYAQSFFMPIFPVQDMSLEIVQARGVEKDTGGTAYRFGVLHENGVLVEYRCDGLTAQQVWDMVEATQSQ